MSVKYTKWLMHGKLGNLSLKIKKLSKWRLVSIKDMAHANVSFDDVYEQNVVSTLGAIQKNNRNTRCPPRWEKLVGSIDPDANERGV